MRSGIDELFDRVVDLEINIRSINDLVDSVVSRLQKVEEALNNKTQETKGGKKD